MKIIKAKTPGKMWKKLIKETLVNGSTVYDGDVKLTEALNIIFEVSHPTKTDAILNKHANVEMIKWMKNNFLSTNSIDGWGYSYGQRISNYMGENQLDTIVSKLKNNKESKSATVTLSCPPEDKKHSPCVNIIDFKYRDNQLNATVFMRSQDTGKKNYADIICLGIILEKIAKEINVEPGKIIIHVASLHIYEADLPDLQKKFPDLF